jgi:hypothetical protein
MRTKEKSDLIIERLRNNKGPKELDIFQKNYLTINQDGDLRQLFTVMLDNKVVDGLNEKIISFFELVQKATEYIISTNGTKYLARIGRLGVDVEGLRKRPSSILLGYSRFDGVFTDEGYELLECNFRRPQMFRDADWISEHLKSLANLTNDKAEENTAELVDTIIAHFAIAKGDSNIKPKNIVLVSDLLRTEYKDVFYNQLAKEVGEEHLILLTTEELKGFYKDSNQSSEGIFFNNQQIELFIIQSNGEGASFYKENGAIRDARIAECYNKQQIEIFTPPSAFIAGNKILLEILHDTDFQAELKMTHADLATLEILPESLSDYEYGREVRSHNDYVIKAIGTGSGRGITLGSGLTTVIWEQKLTDLRDRKKKFIIQKEIRFGAKDICLLDSGKIVSAFVTLEPFIINNPLKSKRPRVTGYSSRAIPVELFKSEVKFNPFADRPEIYLGGLLGTSV